MKLIDADRLMRGIELKAKEKNPEVASELREINKYIAHLLPDYDVKKVIDQLKKEVGSCMGENCEEYEWDCDACTADKAVKIVKNEIKIWFAWRFIACIYSAMNGKVLYSKKFDTYEEAKEDMESNIERFADIEYPPAGRIIKDYIQIT